LEGERKVEGGKERQGAREGRIGEMKRLRRER